MIDASRTAGLRIADWVGGFDQGSISGSVYAVPPSLRLEAARMLTSGGHRVHVDLIVAPDGAHTGVSPEELVLIWESVPGARLDVHLIILDAGPAAPDLAAPAWRSVKAAIRTAQQLKAETLTLSPDAMRTFSEILTSPSDTKPALWAEVAVGEEIPELRGVEGVLVMLIESGSRHAADRSQLRRIPALATLSKVGIDGGVNASVAAEARAAGAGLIVSGRALFEHIQERKATHVD